MFVLILLTVTGQALARESDAQRHIGEQRQFRVLFRRETVPNHYLAELRVVSDHGYIYTVARRDGDPLPTDEYLQEIGRVFDTWIYRQALELWDIDDPPAIDGDERIVILLVSIPDTGAGIATEGWYSARGDLPDEPLRHGIGYLGLGVDVSNNRPVDFWNLSRTLAHEFGHMLHHHTGGDKFAHSQWVTEGLAIFTDSQLELDQKLLGHSVEWDFSAQATRHIEHAGVGARFLTYLYDRLGAQALRDFGSHPQQGLAALDTLLAGRADGLDSESFFADWVIADYLNDAQRGEGRYGYSSPWLQRNPPPSLPDEQLRKFPVTVRDATEPYSVRYYELSRPQNIGAEDRLLLNFDLPAAAAQDAWLQLVQVLPDRVDIRRFRAADWRNRPVVAPLEGQPERVFITISPVNPGAPQRKQAAPYVFTLQYLPAPVDERAQVSAILNVRSGPGIANSILGQLQPCSLVQVLQRGEQWSRVLNAEGLGGWSHNDYLFHLNDPGAGAPATSCAHVQLKVSSDPSPFDNASLAGDADSSLARQQAPVRAVGQTDLSAAAANGHDAILWQLLAAGADVEQPDAEGRSALMLAAANGEHSSFAPLLNAGANINLLDSEGHSPLTRAAANGHALSVAWLLLGNADIHHSLPVNGRNALHLAAAAGHADVIAMLLLDEADVAAQDADGFTPLQLAAAAGHDRIVPWLEAAEAGEQQSRRVDSSLAPDLLAAARNGNLAEVDRLIRANAPVNTFARGTRNKGQTPVMLAAQAGHRDVVLRLLLADASPNARRDWGYPALFYAIENGFDDISAMLLLAGAAPTGAVNPTDPGHSALTWAAGWGRNEIVHLLFALRYHRFSYISRLVDVNVSDYGDWAPLFSAVRGGYTDIVRSLLAAGADPNLLSDPPVNKSILDFCSAACKPEIRAMLLAAGAEA